MAIFIDQGFVTITLETNYNIAAAAVRRILYKDPRGTTGYFAADLVGTTQLRYQATNTSFTYSGEWRFQAYVEIGGLKAYGGIVYETIKTHL